MSLASSMGVTMRPAKSGAGALVATPGLQASPSTPGADPQRKLSLRHGGIGGPSDAWRKTFVLTSKRRHERILDTCITKSTDAAKWSSSLTSIEGTPFFAVGSGAKTGNLFIVENNAVNKLAAPETYTPPQDSLVLRSAFSLPTQVFHLASMGDKLAVAGPDSTIEVFRLDKSELGQKGKGLIHTHECVLADHLPQQSNLLSPPGVIIQSTRVRHVEFEPSQPSTLANSSSKSTSKPSPGSGAAGTPSASISGSGVDGVRRIAGIVDKRVIIYDLPTTKVVASAQPGNDVLYRAAYSPHAPFGSLLATGGLDTHLYLFDTRVMRSQHRPDAPISSSGSSSGVIWRAHSAHTQPILDIQFNHFVPYWVATSSADGSIKVWDIRFGVGPAARIDGHYSAVNAIAWSNTHCDIIASASTDRSWRAWAIQSDQMTAKRPWADMFVGCPGSEFMSAFDANGGISTSLGALSLGKNNSGSIAIGARIVGENQTNYIAPVVAVVASPMHADTFVAVSAAGEVLSHTIRSELFEQLAPHAYEDAAIQEIETKVYGRNLDDAYKLLVQFSRNSRSNGQMVARHEKELLKLVALRPSLEPGTSSTVTTEHNDAANDDSGATRTKGRSRPKGLMMPKANAESPDQIADALSKSNAVSATTPTEPTSATSADPSSVSSWVDGYETRKNTGDMLVTFRNDLENFKYGLPPGFGNFPHWSSTIDVSTQHQLDLVSLRLRILDEVMVNQNWQSILQNENNLYTGMEVDSEFLDRRTIHFFVEEVIMNAYVKGMAMGLRFGEIVADTPKSAFGDLSETMGLLLFPTVFDSAEWLPDLQTVLARQPVGFRQAKVGEYVVKSRKLRAVTENAAMVMNTGETAGSATSSDPGSAAFTSSNRFARILNISAATSANTSPSHASMQSTQSSTRTTMHLTPMSGKRMDSKSPHKRGTSSASSAVSGSIITPNSVTQKSDTGPATIALAGLVEFAEAVERKNGHISKAGADPKEILPMISLEIRLVKIIERQSDTIDEDIVAAMQQSAAADTGVAAASSMRARGATLATTVGISAGPSTTPFEKTISATVNKMYLDALLATKRFEDFFGSALDLIASQVGPDFARIVFRLMEGDAMAKLKAHTDGFFTAATAQLQPLLQAAGMSMSGSGGAGNAAGTTATGVASGSQAPAGGAAGPAAGMPGATVGLVTGAAAAMATRNLVHSSKLIRDALVIVIKVSAHVMQGQELVKTATDRTQLDCLMRIMTQMTTMTLQLSNMLTRSFECFDRTLGKGNGTTKEWAQTVHDMLRDAARTFPLSSAVAKARPVQVSEKAATGHTIHEDIYSLLDKLYKNYR